MSDSPAPTLTIGETCAAWRDHAARIGGRDTMMHYRDSRDGSIELTGAHPSGLAQLLAGRATRLSSLLRDPEHLSDARRRARSIRTKAERLAGERGLSAAHLAIGFAAWSSETDAGRDDLCAPVILRRITLVPRGSRVEDFEIVLDDEVTINPALVRWLADEHDISVDVDEWVDSTGGAHGFDPAPVFDRLRRATRGVPGMLINERLIISTFANIADSYAAESLPEGHPVLRALAGDDEARATFSEGAPAAEAAQRPRPLADRPPQEEFLALDVDGDQQAVVDAALTGASLAVDTPPGTGATQLSAALATSLAHTGHSVLYVAQNADALDDFAARMAAAGLDGFSVDGRGDRASIRRALIGHITAAERAEQPDLTGLLDDLNAQRATLREHAESLHRAREPWGMSAYGVMQRLAGLTAAQPGPSTSVRFSDDVLSQDAAERDRLRSELVRLSDLGAFTLDVSDTVWFGSRFDTDDDAESARATAQAAAEQLPEFTEKALAVLRESGLNPERTVDAWGEALSLLLDIRTTLDSLVPEVFEHSLTDLLAATGTAEYRSEVGRDMGLMERRRLKKAAREFVRPGAHVDDLHSALLAASQQRAALRELAGRDIRPRTPRGVQDAHALYEDLRAELDRLDPVLATTPDGGDLGDMLVEELQARLTALAEDREALADLPARTKLDEELREAGLGALLDDLRERRVGHDLVGLEFDLALWASVLQGLAGADEHIGSHDGPALHRTAEAFRRSDREYVAAGAARLLWGRARRWKRAIADLRDEASALRDELRSPHTRMRTISEHSPNLFGALAPIWHMGPFQVPELFDDAPLFDTVILADAGRMTVAEALPAIARAKQVIALGDERLLGPREFSVAVDRRTPNPAEELPSVFGELAGFLPMHRLHTSYRVSPAGLIDLPNRHFYDSQIVTVPTALTGEGTGLEFAHVPDALGAPDTATGQVESLDVEVARVVDLVIRHARTRARQSLAVVTLTPWHAQRVATALQEAIRQYPYVASFFRDPHKEPFVVTDCERIHGMARDAVIFSLGYGRTLQGRVLSNFGALSQPGGERLLAAALTRARRKLTIVSAIEADDLDPARLHHGAKLLPAILSEVAAGGEVRTDTGALTVVDEPEDEIGDPIVADIVERLARRGVVAHLDYHGIDMAVANSAEDVRGMILAVDSDGPSYARIDSVRERERLRAEQLERRGWRTARMWTTDAFVDPQHEADAVFEKWRDTVEKLSPQALLNASRAAAVVVDRQGSRPQVASGLPMHMYTDEQLAAMLDWIRSDGVVRTDAELKEQLRSALAQKSRASRVESALEAAVRSSRSRWAESKRPAGEDAGDEPVPAEAEADDAEAVDEPSSPGAAAVMPSFDTGQLRDEDLIEAGLRPEDSQADAADDAASDEFSDDSVASVEAAEAGSGESSDSDGESAEDDAEADEADEADEAPETTAADAADDDADSAEGSEDADDDDESHLRL